MLKTYKGDWVDAISERNLSMSIILSYISSLVSFYTCFNFQVVIYAVTTNYAIICYTFPSNIKGAQDRVQ